MGNRLSSLTLVLSIPWTGMAACSPSRRSECAKDLAASRVVEAAEAARAPALPSPGRDPFFRGIELLAWPLDVKLGPTRPLGPTPVLVQNEVAAGQLRRAAREGGRRDVATIFVFGAYFACRSLPPGSPTRSSTPAASRRRSGPSSS